MADPPRVRAISWDHGLVEHPDVDSALAAMKAGKTTWIDLLGRSPEAERVLGPDGANVHSLVVEDVFGDCTRPKIEDYDTYLYVLFHAPTPTPKDNDPETIDLVEIDLLIGPNWIVTHHAQSSNAIDAVFGDVGRGQKVIQRGAPWLAHAVLDRMVDDYVPLLDQLDQEVDSLEREVLAGETGGEILQRILGVKRQLQQLRRVAIHQKEVLHRLGRGEFDEIPADLLPFVRDVYDHFVRVTDLADSYRDLVASTFEAHLSVQSNKMNAIMKTLTLVSTMFMPLTFIAGIYGMNFEHMPELKTHNGYFVTLGVMALIAVTVLALYRRKKWL
ncbi:MAG: magnesium/cobalt transporter CorA [Polyangiales bacterium]